MSSIISAKHKNLHFPFPNSSTLNLDLSMSLPSESIQLKKKKKSLEKLSSVNKSLLLILKKNLLSDKTSHQALHSSIVLNEAQTPFRHPLGLASTIICHPASLSTCGSVYSNGVQRKTGGLEGQVRGEGMSNGVVQ